MFRAKVDGVLPGPDPRPRTTWADIDAAIAREDPADRAAAGPLLDRLIALTAAGRIEWKRGEQISLWATVGGVRPSGVRLEVYFDLIVGDWQETWRTFVVDVRPLRAAIAEYLATPADAAAVVQRTMAALDEVAK